MEDPTSGRPSWMPIDLGPVIEFNDWLSDHPELARELTELNLTIKRARRRRREIHAMFKT